MNAAAVERGWIGDANNEGYKAESMKVATRQQTGVSGMLRWDLCRSQAIEGACNRKELQWGEPVSSQRQLKETSPRIGPYKGIEAKGWACIPELWRAVMDVSPSQTALFHGRKFRTETRIF